MNPLNYSTISFPFLGLEVNPGRSLDIGPLSIHFYGLCIAWAAEDGILGDILFYIRKKQEEENEE